MAYISVIGGGFSGLAAACCLAKEGHKISLFEKNSTVGGRARVFQEKGFTFDMGPSWYWMADIIEQFFHYCGSSPEEHYTLLKLDPAFRMIFPGDEIIDIPGEYPELEMLFERLEPGAGKKLQQFMSEAALKYEIGVKHLAFKPGKSLREFIDQSLLKNFFRLHLFRRFDTYVARFFKDVRLRKIMEFPILFLGTLPHTTPALYSFMNYGGLVGGTWYPKEGMGKVVQGIAALAEQFGVELHFEQEVTGISCENSRVKTLHLGAERVAVDGIIASADYHHVEQKLLSPEYRRYTSSYWDKRKLAPSALLFYVGVNRKVPHLCHHTLFFDVDFSQHAQELYQNPSWPSDPLFYVCAPSCTDPTVAPEGSENLFILIPLAAGLIDSDERREALFEKVLTRIERVAGVSIKEHIVFRRSYCLRDFVQDYHALKGNAYGLANTLTQTALGKPEIQSSRVQGLVFAGQLTVPGPGVPPALISGQIAAQELLHQLSS